MMAIRRVKRTLGSLRRKIVTEIDLLVWQYSPARNVSDESLIAHLLVVKNSMYSQIAKICTLSFLHYHPKSRVIIHVDESTHLAVAKWAKSCVFAESITVQLVETEPQESWQVQKTNLVLSLSGTRDLFVDADMRWNGPINLKDYYSKTVCFFVEEYRISNHDKLSKMLEHPDFSRYGSASMWNTSFICFSGFSLSATQKHEILELQNRIIHYAKTHMSEESLSTSTIRISEQLAISLAATNWDVHLKALKLDDGYKDGSFLESSYFGATGTHF